MSKIDWRQISPPCSTSLQDHGGTFIKWEGDQPSGSVKYRWVYARVVEAILAGRISRETTLVEASQGYAGVALAHIGQQLRLPVELHTGPDISPTMERYLRAYDATIITHPDGRALPEGLADFARREAQGTAWHLNQYNRAALISGYSSLAAEVVAQLNELGTRRPSTFMCPIGTGGMIQGVGIVLRQHFPDLKIVAIEASPGEHLGGTIRNTSQMHMGPLDPYDRLFPDETWYVKGTGNTTHIGDRPLVQSGSLILDAISERGYHDGLVITPE